jgi:hypothetical protein
MMTALENMDFAIKLVVFAEGHLCLTIVEADYQFDEPAESGVIEAWTFVNTAVVLAQEHNDLVVQLPLEADCMVTGLWLLLAAEVFAHTVGRAVLLA